MSLPTRIEYNNNVIRVTPYGELVTGKISYSTPSVQLLDTASTGYVFIDPKVNNNIVLTGVYMYGNKNVSATIEADVELYTSTTGSGTTVEDSLIQVGLLKQQSIYIPLNTIVDVGVWVMGKTSDDDIKVSLFYYYLEN